ncbi:unnamed protein product [Ilex paraguariensis]|uniref:Uncharacterized protein n=1 Tax=Ilex paraguariensis TaxID=185542 RepID=A0ABC8TUE9_9AQUA
MKRKNSCNHPPFIDPSSNPVDPSVASSLPFVDNSREKMKRKKNCNYPLSIDPYSKVDPRSTNLVTLSSSNPVDPSFNTSTSSNPIPNPTINEIISVRGMKDKRRCLPIPILISKIMEDYGVVIHSSDANSTPMNPIYGGTIKKSLGQGKKKKTQQPQVEIENEVEAEDEVKAQDVPNSSTDASVEYGFSGFRAGYSSSTLRLHGCFQPWTRLDNLFFALLLRIQISQTLAMVLLATSSQTSL